MKHLSGFIYGFLYAALLLVCGLPDDHWQFWALLVGTAAIVGVDRAIR